MATGNPKSSLHILPEESPLRGETGFSHTMQWPPEADYDPPRALRSLSAIVNGGLCHRCGSCAGICPTGAIAMDTEGYPRVAALSACTDCDLCVRVCPGDEFDYFGFTRQLFGKEADLSATHGSFEKAVIAHTTDEELREKATSGGLISALLLHLFDTCQIDGAALVGSDSEVLWKGRPVLARSRDEVSGCAKSKYAISPTNSVYKEILSTPGRYAVVGLPCQIHGFMKAASLDPRLKERVVLSIGLFCHAAVEHEAFEVIWQSLGERATKARRFISRVGKPGAPHIEMEDGSLYPVYFGEHKGYRPTSLEVINILYRLYTPPRCLTCFDALSEFADISVGDPWMAPPSPEIDFDDGWSFALLRTERGVKLYEQAVRAGAVKGLDLTRREALKCNSLMAGEKRWRAFRVMETQRRQGRAIPQYYAGQGHCPQHSGWQFIKTEIHMLTHIFCFLPRWRMRLLRIFLGSAGYYLFWLNSKRRSFRFWRRDALESLRRLVFGRA